MRPVMWGHCAGSFVADGTLGLLDEQRHAETDSVVSECDRTSHLVGGALAVKGATERAPGELAGPIQFAMGVFELLIVCVFKPVHRGSKQLKPTTGLYLGFGSCSLSDLLP